MSYREAIQKLIAKSGMGLEGIKQATGSKSVAEISKSLSSHYTNRFDVDWIDTVQEACGEFDLSKEIAKRIPKDQINLEFLIELCKDTVYSITNAENNNIKPTGFATATTGKPLERIAKALERIAGEAINKMVKLTERMNFAVFNYALAAD